MIGIIGFCALLVFMYMTALFFLAVHYKDNSIVDVAWGPGFILIALTSLALSASIYWSKLIVLSLTCIWGIRLAVHIYLRNKGKGEDPRYAAWRKEWGAWVHMRSFFQVFMLQGLVMLIVSLPILWVMVSVHALAFSWLYVFGIALWVIGFLFEVIGDWQLKRFLSSPDKTSSVMTQGLWQYTRHPNYFGESLIWWGFFVMALNAPYGYVTIVSPLLITYLLRFVSGVPMAEKAFENNTEYQAYARRTSPFVPWI